MAMRVLVVDDEPLARRRLIRLLGRMSDVEIAGEAANGLEALEVVNEKSPDLILLDIRMPGMDGLEFAGARKDLPPIIFTTAYDEYAVQAFEANAIDYLLKPVQAERLEKALARAKKQSAPESAARLDGMLKQLLSRTGESTQQRITARSGKTVRVFDPTKISRFWASDRYTVFRFDGSEFILDDTLNTLEEKLGAVGFVRVHRSELINLNLIESLHLEEGASEVTLSDGQKAPVSRRLVADLKRKLGMSE